MPLDLDTQEPHDCPALRDQPQQQQQQQSQLQHGLPQQQHHKGDIISAINAAAAKSILTHRKMDIY